MSSPEAPKTEETVVPAAPAGGSDVPRSASAAAAVAPGKRPDMGRRRAPFPVRRKVCRFCAEKVRDLDYKQIQVLRTFVSENGKILSSRVTGNCAGHQRQLSRAIKRARNLALLPYVVK